MARLAARRLGLGAVTLFLSCAIAGMVGEVIVRLLLPPPYIPKPSPVFGTIDPFRANPYIIRMRPYLYLHIPGSTYYEKRSSYRVRFEINSRAFRGPEISSPDRGHARRLLVVGDSMVEGQGVAFDDTFAALLDRAWQPRGWQVINVGVQGASPLYYAANIDRYLALSPDVVLIVLYENDIADDRSRERNYFELPYLIVPSSVSGGGAWLDTLHASRFVDLVETTWHTLRTSPVGTLILENLNGVEALGSSEEQEAYRSVGHYLIAPSRFDAQWRMTQRYLDFVADRLSATHTSVLLANLSVLGMDPASRAEFKIHSRALDEHASRWAAHRGISFISLLPTLEALFRDRQPERVAIPNDGHLTSESHVVVASVLQAWLTQQLVNQGR